MHANEAAGQREGVERGVAHDEEVEVQSRIAAHRGEALAEADSKFEQEVVARLPLASYRQTHQIPDLHLALYQPVFDRYQPRQAPGLFSRYLPTDLKDAKRFLDEKNSWR